ncbi:hypothetical protein TNCV_1317021 [Trichonephila clavipes]|nr:hypothetical protein TNCV_1317021 [Trichonephila clavipes]
MVKGLPPLFLFHQPHERTCGSRRLFRVPPAAKVVYIHKRSRLLRDSNPRQMAPQSTSLTTIPDGRLA